MIEHITRHLFSTAPAITLYHYTSLSGLLGIVSSGELRASDVRYMNDSAELRHTLDLISTQVTRRIIAGTDCPELLDRFLEWLSHGIVGGALLFGASFREKGNLLSQWRGYSGHGKGVSLGFNPRWLLQRAEQQFLVAKCLYDKVAQNKLVEQIVGAVERHTSDGTRGDRPDCRASFMGIFEQIEGDLLRIAALLKKPSFEEEQEWRLVSPLIADGSDERVRFREGHSMLLPCYTFELGRGPSGALRT
jgi:hypothetical protein